MNRLDRLASFLLEPSRTEPPPVETQSPKHEEPGPVVRPTFPALPVSGCLVRGMQASCNAWRWQIEQCDPSLVARPQLNQIMEQLHSASGSCFDLRLPRVRLASGVLQHCIAITAAIARVSLRFKVGITTDPVHRFLNSSYGYSQQGIYKQMTIIAILKSMEAAAFLEAALIREFRDHHACGNEAAGGEGSSTDSVLGFVYVVRCDFPPCKRQKVS